MPKTTSNRSGFCITASLGQATIRAEVSITWLLVAASVAIRLYSFFAGMPR